METAALTSEQSMIKITVPPLPRSRSLQSAVCWPAFLLRKALLRAQKHRTMSAKPLSSSSRLTVTRPRAGSFTAPFFLNPQSTTKMAEIPYAENHGKSHFEGPRASMRYPAASRE